MGQLTYVGENSRKRKRERNKQKKFEMIITDNFPKLMLHTKPQIREAQRTQSMINEKTNKQTIPRYIIFVTKNER